MQHEDQAQYLTAYIEQEIDLSVFDDEERKDMLAKMTELIEERMLARVTETLSESEAAELSELFDTGSPEQVQEYISAHVPRFVDIVTGEVAKLKEQIDSHVVQ